MDILKILDNDKRVIVLTSETDRSIYTWDHANTIEWWRPKIHLGYQCNPNDWESVSTFKYERDGLRTFNQARKLALKWYNHHLDYPEASYADG